MLIENSATVFLLCRWWRLPRCVFPLSSSANSRNRCASLPPPLFFFFFFFFFFLKHLLDLVAYSSVTLLVTVFFHLYLFPPFISNFLKFCPSYNKRLTVLVIRESSCDVWIELMPLVSENKLQKVHCLYPIYHYLLLPKRLICTEDLSPSPVFIFEYP